MKKLLLIIIVLILAAGGVVVWNNKGAQLPASFPLTLPVPSPAVNSCEPMRGPCLEVYTKDWYYDDAFNKCVQPHSACQGSRFTTKEECERLCLQTRSSAEMLILPHPPLPITNNSSTSKTILKMQGYQFDPLAGIPSIPSELSTNYPSNTPGLHIIQLFGPTQDPWLDQIGNSGVEILQYIAPYSYLVRMTPEQAKVVESFDFIRWVGVYHPIYRISSNLSGSGGIIPVSITIYDGGSTVDKTIGTITGLGAEFLGQEKAGVTDPFVTTRFNIFAPQVLSVARLNEVVWINLGFW